MSQPSRKKNVYVIGAQCTGKTTLVNALRDRLTDSPRPTIIEETAREVMQEYGFSRQDNLDSQLRASQLQDLIVQAQLEAERKVFLSTRDAWYISDRSALDAVVYATIHAQPGKSQELLSSDKWTELERRMKDGCVFLCCPVREWLVDDGTEQRVMPVSDDEWSKINHLFIHFLRERDIGFEVIDDKLKGTDARVAFVLITMEKKEAEARSATNGHSDQDQSDDGPVFL